MLHRWNAGSFVWAIAMLGTAASLSACGSGAEAATGTTTVVETPAPPPPTPPGPPPAPPPAGGLDAQLNQLARQAGAASIPAAPAQDPARVALGQALFFDRI